MKHDLLPATATRPAHPYCVQTITDPCQETLRSLALAHTPAVTESHVGNLVKVSRNKARKAQYTYVIAPESAADQYSCKIIDRVQAEALIRRQKVYIEETGTLVEVRGYIGLGARAVPTQWLYTPEAANIAGMQQILSFPVESVLKDNEDFEHTFRVVYTPGCPATGLPGEQAILVDMDNYVTYILGPDYFGESKKGALRMLNHLIYQQGGLVLHAGAKEVTVDGQRISMTIMGLSGTGKTTTTFSKQGEVTRPIQDDMVSLWPNGELSITENGCFAKTYGLTEDSEPVIYRGTMSREAWVENVYSDQDGHYDFFKDALTPEEVASQRDVLIQTGAPAANVDAFISGQTSIADVTDGHDVLLDGWDFVRWTQNGRSIIPMSAIEDAANLSDIPVVQSMGILNRDEGSDAATPGIVQFTSPEQAAGYFMLGETTKTSAAGKEVGKTRSPFTQPFFPLAHGLQASRFSELAASMPGVDLWMMNTGYIGGSAVEVGLGTAFKVKIRHSSAMLEAMLKGAIVWKADPDFGYNVVDVDHSDNADLVAAVGIAILNPRRWYADQGRGAEYAEWVARMKMEREAFLTKYGVDPAIVRATLSN